jgi:hypothetical protein
MARELVERALRMYEILTSPLVDKYNSLVYEYENVMYSKVKIPTPLMRKLQIAPRKFKKLAIHPVPHCVEENWEFSEVNFTGRTICLVDDSGYKTGSSRSFFLGGGVR